MVALMAMIWGAGPPPAAAAITLVSRISSAGPLRGLGSGGEAVFQRCYCFDPKLLLGHGM